jgi:hypothetical protein
VVKILLTLVRVSAPPVVEQRATASVAKPRTPARRPSPARQSSLSKPHTQKGHCDWALRQPFPGIYLRRDPDGVIFLVDRTGTRRRPQEHTPVGTVLKPNPIRVVLAS